ncbi:Retrovirus-related Pol polyprotein from transposon RE1 [Vitis vinifera]|uniref:Retrovirus-related Pol polyprotein from transposon RE1 n=1 Tax=Vitis vinifera TaxID=29760 RepID=A0A438IC95_VITVI|nr:Retrovirus-related Pol polyprotein from transposon RE1 [Vitis vinifera]
MMKCTHINTPKALKSITTPSDEQPIDPTRYRQLAGSLQYLTFTRPDIVHAVNKVGQHFQAPTKVYFHSWSSKRQPTVSRSSTEDEYRSLASSATEITWLTFLLHDIGIQLREPPQLLCDNLSALHMTVNLVFPTRSKHIELDHHFVREKVASGVLITCFLPLSLQVVDIFTKALPKT